jgi:CDP-diacylglycerol---glycerol-3-phosphate 3-phosphatidyltransferase
MLRAPLKNGVTQIITPLARAMVKVGITANAITVVGAIGSWIASLLFFTQGIFFIGTLVIALFLLSDLFDGTIARITDSQGTRFGALLDSTLDRISDAVLVLALIVWAMGNEVDWILPLALSMVFGFLISYIKARAESLGVSCEVGVAERSERLIVLLTATGLYGLGIDSAMIIGLWFLVLITAITVVQRFVAVMRNA